MNILIPYYWLKEHLDSDATPEEMQKILSLSGPSIERIEEKMGESVFDIEVTTNRMDMASVRGIAREAAVILTHSKKPSTMKTVKEYTPKKGEVVENSEKLPITITNDPKLCSRIMGVFMDVSLGESPEWMKKRLEQVGIRSLNNLVDITNYVMIEYGQPMHVFDADRLGDTMIIRESKKGETIITLDGKTHTLQGGDIVVDNGHGELIDLIGIMGTENSVVTSQTRRIFLFSEHPDAKHIRKTSMSLAIRTNAAQLNEKMLDPNLVGDAMLRAIYLYTQTAQGKCTSPILDEYPDPKQSQTIVFPLALTKRYLGMDIPTKLQVAMLKQLGCGVVENGEVLHVTIPTQRPDIEIPVDLVEEIARIYGYHNLPSVLMDTSIPTAYPQNQDFSLEYTLKQFLADIGLQEVYTYSGVSKTLAQRSGTSEKQHLELLNPLTDEHVYMRTTLIPSLLEVLTQNKIRRDLCVFEIANTYIPQEKDLPKEELHLGMVIQKSFRDAKGIVDALLSRFYRKATYSMKNTLPGYGAGETEIIVDGKTIGTLGVTHQDIVYVDIHMPSLIQVARKYPQYKSISTFTPITEHLTFTLTQQTQIGDVLKTIQESDQHITRAELLDMYEHNATFEVSYEDEHKQLSSQDALQIRKKLIACVKKDHDGKLVGNV